MFANTHSVSRFIHAPRFAEALGFQISPFRSDLHYKSF